MKDVLGQKAQVGNTVFGVGVDVSTVIDRAYREYQYKQSENENPSGLLDKSDLNLFFTEHDINQIKYAAIVEFTAWAIKEYGIEVFINEASDEYLSQLLSNENARNNI